MTISINYRNIISWIFGMLVLSIGIINIFWGNDLEFGIFVSLLSLVYVPPVTDFITKATRISLPMVIKIILGLFILWAAFGVGELFNKIDLMLLSF